MTLPQSPPVANRGPIPISSISTALTYTPPIQWVQVTSAGSGGLVVKDERGDARTYAGLVAGQTIYGPFNELTSMTLTSILAGDGRAPMLPVGAQNYSNANTSALTQAAALDELELDGHSALEIIFLPATSFVQFVDGTPLPVFANGASTIAGFYSDAAKVNAARWNNDAAPGAICTSFQIPPTVDTTVNAVLHIRAAKTGATNNAGNTPTFLVTAANQVDGALYDADTNFGGTSSAMLPAATAKTIQNVTLTLALADLAAYPASVSLSLGPTAGTLNTDDLLFFGAYLVCKRKLRTS